MGLEQFNNPAVLLALVAGLTIGLNQFLKKIGLPEKFCPVVNLVFGGSLATILLLEMGFTIFHSVIVGILIGLGAGGFYDLKEVFKKWKG